MANRNVTRRLIPLLITALALIGIASNATAKPKHSQVKETRTVHKRGKNGKKKVVVTKTKKRGHSKKGNKGKRSQSKRRSHEKRSHYASSHRHQKRYQYRDTYVHGRHYYARNGRYYTRVRHGHSWYHEEVYPVGARYDVLPGRAHRVVRGNRVLFRVGPALFRPTYRHGRTFYIVVR